MQGTNNETRQPLGPNASRQSQSIPQVRRAGWLVGAAVLGGMTGLVCLSLVVAVRNRGRLPELAPADLYSARERWEQAEIDSYALTVRVTGRQAAVYHVEVRDGQVVVSTRNARPLTQERTRGTWSVPGMFGTIQSDVTNLERRLRGEPGGPATQLLIRGVFHAHYGYPVRYHRTEFRRWTNNEEVSWETTEFRLLE